MSEAAGCVRRALGILCGARHVDDANRAGVALAVTEAVTNSCRHGYPDHDVNDMVEVSVDREGEDLLVTVVDHGCGHRVESRDAGAGLGIALMRKLASTCSHTQTDGGGTTVQLRFARVLPAAGC